MLELVELFLLLGGGYVIEPEVGRISEGCTLELLISPSDLGGHCDEEPTALGWSIGAFPYIVIPLSGGGLLVRSNLELLLFSLESLVGFKVFRGSSKVRRGKFNGGSAGVSSTVGVRGGGGW